MFHFPSFIQFLGLEEIFVILAIILILYLALKRTRRLK